MSHMEPLGETAPTQGPRRRVAYYYDPDISTYGESAVVGKDDGTRVSSLSNPSRPD